MRADAVLLIAFGGPTRPEEIRPFLDNVTRGRPIPPERLETVVRHYERIGGRSPLNPLTFAQADALRRALPSMPVYVGMRNWTPYVRETIAEMTLAGVRRAVGIIMAPHETESSRERYVTSVAEACAAAGPRAPEIVYPATWHAHPRFVEALTDLLGQAIARVPGARRANARIVFTAHSVPVASAVESPYERELMATARAVATAAGVAQWQLAYQSRSGNPREPWLDPDVNDVIRAAAAAGVRDVVVEPIGFVCDHVEVLYDLDVEARATAEALGLGFVRARAVNDHPAFIAALADVVHTTADG